MEDRLEARQAGGGVQWASLWLVVLLTCALAGCVSSAAGRLADSLSSALLDQRDPEIVRSGAPAYLILVDSLIADQPDNERLLVAGARLYGAYASGLVAEEKRRQILASRALSYARRAFCPTEQRVCQLSEGAFEPFSRAVTQIADGELMLLYVFATSWADWIQAHQSDWNAIAQLPKVDLLLQRVVDRDPGFDRGRAQLYLGVLHSLRPKNLGGDPEKGRAHFELAIKHSKGRDLMAKVEYARRYARLVFQRELHDRLLKEVLAADPSEPGLTLSNVLAQQQAQELINDDYF